MPSLVPSYEYDVFISYRQNDNRSGWVTEFVKALEEELAAAIKDPVSIYFDVNPHDGLLETHNVNKSLEGKLKCLIFIPVLSQTYCDPKSFAWQHEFCAFNKLALQDQFGRDIKLGNGNVASRILPIRIHNLEGADKNIIQSEIGGPLRSLDFIYKSPGVNRPLRSNEENPEENLNHTIYRNQINKVANATKEIIYRLRGLDGAESPSDDSVSAKESDRFSSDQHKPRTSSSEPSTYSQEIRSGSRYSAILVVAAIIFFSALTGLIVWKLKTATRVTGPAVVRTSISLPESNPLIFLGEASLGIGRKSLSISSDGKHIVYLGRSEKATKLFLRNIDEDRVLEIPNTEGAYNPVFSPDGSHIAFFQKNSLRKIRLDGSESIILAQESNMFDIAWRENNELYFSAHEGRKLYRVKDNITSLSIDTAGIFTGFFQFRYLEAIPGSKYLLHSGRDRVGIYDLDANVSTLLPIRGSGAHYLPTGHLLFVQGSILMAVGFNVSTLQLTSEPVEILSGFRIDDSRGQFDFSLNGTLAFVRGENAQVASFVFHNMKNGKDEPLNMPSQQYQQFSLSPDGTAIAAPEFHNGWNINVFDLKSRKTIRLDNDCSLPVWHPDGSKIFYRKDGNAHYKSIDSGETTLFMKNSLVSSFSQDGRLVGLSRNGKVYVRQWEDSTMNFIATGNFASIAPDGKSIAYTRNDSEGSQVYLEPFPRTGQKWQVSLDVGSEESRWSRDGKRIYYRWAKKWMMVPVERKPQLQLGSPTQLFEGEYVNTPGYSYDLAPNEEKFLLVKGNYADKSNQINIVQGWFEELHRLAPLTK